MRIGHLWVQQVAEYEVLTYKEVKGGHNPADISTKYLNDRKMDEQLGVSMTHRDMLHFTKLIIMNLVRSGANVACLICA